MGPSRGNSARPGESVGASAAADAGCPSSAAARRTLFEVHREQRWRVWSLFGLLVAVALIPVLMLSALAWALLYVVRPAAGVFTAGLSWYHWVPSVVAAVGGALVYWYASHRHARQRLLTAMGGRPLDIHDRYHRRLADIVEELRLAAGRPHVEAVVVPSLGMNAFAFSDLHGGSVVGVTEGAVSRLPRPQLQAVLAHEFAHVLAGSHVTTTTACMLFGVWDSAADAIDSAAGRETHGDSAVRGVSGAAAGLLRLLGAFVNGALSRQREFEADLAAVRYTRDPVSLALALRTIAAHPVGAGYVPPGLAALCITAESAAATTRLERALASHPPVADRIAALLHLANMGAQRFEELGREADERLVAREHVDLPPGGRSSWGAAGAPRLPGWRERSTDTRGVSAGQSPKCPTCGYDLRPADYESVVVWLCAECGGRLVRAADAARVVARREVAFTERQRALAAQVTAAGDDLRRAAVRRRPAPRGDLRACPLCGRTMTRRHYSYDVAVDVDCCLVCEVLWFDADELEVVQILGEESLG